MNVKITVPTNHLAYCSLLLFGIFYFSSQATASTIHTLKIDNSVIDIKIQTGLKTISASQVNNWIENGASAIVRYYTLFPVSYLIISVSISSGRGVKTGRTFGHNGALIQLGIGEDTTINDLRKDWILVHEMTHLAFPNLAERHRWLTEGIATYVEPLARSMIKQYTVEKVWEDLVKNIPKGLPKSGDKGLDNTPTWGRTYWGGALYCLLADIQLRKLTKNRYGLQDALAAIAMEGHNVTKSSTIVTILSVGDKATGTTVLLDLYNDLKDQPGNVDLQNLWQQLGISYEHGIIHFNQQADLADIRQRITLKVHNRLE